MCALLWSTEHRELISSHGFAQNQLIIWKYPAMSKIAELTGHTARVLHMAMSPDGTTVVSAGADETLRLWKCFAVDEKKKTTQKSASKSTSSTLHRALIRWCSMDDSPHSVQYYVGLYVQDISYTCITFINTYLILVSFFHWHWTSANDNWSWSHLSYIFLAEILWSWQDVPVPV